MSILSIGLEQGEKIGLEQGKKIGLERGILFFIESCQEFGLTKDAVREKMIGKFSLEVTEAENYLEKYWKE